MPSGMIALAAQPTQSKRVSETIVHAASNCIESIVEVAERECIAGCWRQHDQG
jgi:hypothetical protein